MVADKQVDLNVNALAKKLRVSPKQINKLWPKAILVARRMGQEFNTDFITGILKTLMGKKPELAIESSPNLFIQVLNNIFLKERKKYPSFTALLDAVLSSEEDLSELTSGDLGDTPENVLDGNSPTKKKKDEAKDEKPDADKGAEDDKDKNDKPKPETDEKPDADKAPEDDKKEKSDKEKTEEIEKLVSDVLKKTLT